MAPNALISPIVFVLVSNVYATVVLIGAVLVKSSLLDETEFSRRKFYLLMGWVPLVFLALSIAVDARYLLFFVATGVLGILGELLVSFAWRRFFDEPIWTYGYRSIFGGYTSTLNFLPWAVGALLFHLTTLLFGRPIADGEPVTRPLLVSALSLGAGVALAWPIALARRSRDGRFSKRRFWLFCVPILTTALALGIACGIRYPLLMFAFAMVGSLAEYGYGRTMSIFFQQPLWTYNHWKIDGGHTSFVTAPLWALGGLYFYFIAESLSL